MATFRVSSTDMADGSDSDGETNPARAAPLSQAKREMPQGRPFPKGVSGNPKGRPSYKKLGKKLRLLEPAALAALKADLEGPPSAERSRAVAMVFAYRYGKPYQQIQHTGAGGEALHITIEIQRTLQE